MILYEIVQSLRNASGSLAKQAILDANKDNALFKAYMKAVYDVGINYYATKLPAGTKPGNLATLDQEYLDWLAKAVKERVFAGDKGKSLLKVTMSTFDAEGCELFQYIIKRSIGASVGDSMVLRTWPDLYFLPPYMRCSLLDAKARERFGKLKKFVVQTKSDGSFAYVVRRMDGTVDVITRQGSKYPQAFAEKLAQGLEPGKVLVGELLVDEVQAAEGWGEARYHLDRKTANGLLNSALKDGEKLEENKYYVHMQAWDMLTQEEFEAGSSLRPYVDRFDILIVSLRGTLCQRVQLIQTDEVTSLEEAFAIYQQRLQEGLEGCIIKDPASLWKDGTSRDMVKLKIKFEVEMRVTGYYEGEGKAAGTLGGIYIRSEDGGINCACGSGFSDAQRQRFMAHPEDIVNKVVAIEANDITQSRDGRKKPALSLPIFCEVRYDKHVADTTERIYAQLEAAKQGS